MRLRKGTIIVTVALGLLTTPLFANAQQLRKLPRIGWLGVGALGPNTEAFRQGLRDLGYVEGQNIAFEYRAAEGRSERLPDVAAELTRLKVDVIVTEGWQATRAAKQSTGTIPIVMIHSGDPVATGLVASLARPGGNLTGLLTLSPELIGKRLELLKEAVPGVSRVAVLWNGWDPAVAGWLKEMEVSARFLGLQLQSLEVRGPDDFDKAFSAITKEKAGALVEVPSPIFHRNRKRIVEFTTKNRLPAAFHSRDFVDAGGLMTYGANYPDLFRRAAVYVDKILKGAKPADLPVEQPMRFDLIINLKAAKALGLTIPQSVLIRADKMIQ